ncbi:MAG: hypothetical protein GWP17_02270 [Aquificales bacterium]|nr:hypothetical protein [Aquificales bacterium]
MQTNGRFPIIITCRQTAVSPIIIYRQTAVPPIIVYRQTAVFPIITKSALA